jgi:hypothetical protein
MMLRTKSGDLHYKVVDPATGEEWQVDPLQYVTRHQYRSMIGKPDMILELAHHIRDSFAEDGHEGVAVYAHCELNFNGRYNLQFTDTTVNLSLQPRKGRAYGWVLPFEDK